MLALKIAGIVLLLYGLTFLLGLGLAALLFRDGDSEKIPFYAPWIGAAQTGLVLTAFGIIGKSASFASWFLIALSAAEMLAAFILRQGSRSKKIFLPRIGIVAAVLIAATLLLAPIAVKSSRLTGFTLGNKDIYDYVMTARYLVDHGLKPHLKPFGEQPKNSDAGMMERTVSWQIPAPRWGSYYFLSFLNALFGWEVHDFFSIYAAFMYALFIPLLWQLARALDLKGGPIAIGLTLAIVNPHMVYILYHGFLPQIVGSGFFIGFLSLLPSYVDSAKADIRNALLPALFIAGVLTSYLELFLFLLLAASVYIFWEGFKRKEAALALKKWAILMGLAAALAPYQIKHFFSIVAVHASTTGGGWDVTQRHYFLSFPLGAFFSHPHAPNPSPYLEWLLGPVILFLAVLGVKASPRGRFLICIIFPFILAGAISLAEGWNYRFFKNWTYVYFWLPLAIAGAFNKLQNKKVRGFLFAVVSSIIILAGSLTAKSVIAASKGVLLIPAEMGSFEAASGDSEIKTVFAEGLSYWESLWAGYFLRDKSLILSEWNPYLRNETGSLSDRRYRWLLAKDADLSKIVSNAGRQVESVRLKEPPYALYRLY